MASGWVSCSGFSIAPKGSAVGQWVILGGKGANYGPGVEERPILISEGNPNCLNCAKKVLRNWALRDLRK